MYLADTHTHTYYSTDSKESLESMAQSAIHKRLRCMCFTDHCDIMRYKDPEFNIDWESRRAEYEKIRQRYEKRIRFLCGVEIGEATYAVDIAEKILSENPFDFVLASIHGLRSGNDFFCLEYPTKVQCKKYIEEYLNEIMGLCRWGNFDSLAHLTYPLRYMAGREKIDIDFSDFTDTIKIIFKALIQKGKSLELNTSGVYGNYGEFMPYPELIKLYRECGGELITVGSDAHRAYKTASGIKEGYELLRRLGFRYINIYKNRIPEHIKI